MTTITDLTKPSTWAERISKSETSVQLNLIHNEVTELFKITPEMLNGGDFKENVVDKMMTVVGDLPIDTMITSSPVSEGIDLLHHTTKLGINLLNKEIIYFSLTGKAKTVIPVVYRPKLVLKITEVTCLTW